MLRIEAGLALDLEEKRTEGIKGPRMVTYLPGFGYDRPILIVCGGLFGLSPARWATRHGDELRIPVVYPPRANTPLPIRRVQCVRVRLLRAGANEWEFLGIEWAP